MIFLAKHKQKSSRKAVNSYPPPHAACPAVSVIIPLYNAERYIGDCLDSILAQTFQNFEVIVVDDCSTDSSCAVVENYKERFDGRLTLTHMQENSGGGGLPRNKGLMFSCGEYIYFLDSDDMLTKTALEEMYTLAKDFDADVVYCEKNYEINNDGTNFHLSTHQGGNLVDKPTFQSENLDERVKDLLRRDIWGGPLYKFLRRKFLVDSEIVFPNVRTCEDYLWTLNLYFCAKKFLRVPNAIYVERLSENSITRQTRSDAQTVAFWLTPAIVGLKWLAGRLDVLEFFRNNVLYRYAVLDFVLKKMFGLSFPASLKVSPVAFYEAVRQGFGKNLGEQDVLVAALCTALNSMQKNFLQMRQQVQAFVNNTQAQYKRFNQFAAQTQAREKQFRQFFEHTQEEYKRFNQFAAQAQAREKQIRQFVEHTQEQYKRFNQFAAQAKARIAYLEAELQKRQT